MSSECSLTVLCLYVPGRCQAARGAASASHAGDHAFMLSLTSGCPATRQSRAICNWSASTARSASVQVAVATSTLDDGCAVAPHVANGVFDEFVWQAPFGVGVLSNCGLGPTRPCRDEADTMKVASAWAYHAKSWATAWA